MRESIAIYEEAYPDVPVKYATYLQLGEVLFEQKRYPEAEVALLKGYEGLRQYHAKHFGHSRAKQELFESCRRIVKLFEITNQLEKAHQWRAMLPLEPAPFPRQK